MDYLIHILIMALIYAVFAMALNLELGFAGLYNFGHVAFFGIGAYTTALLGIGGFPASAAVPAALAAAGIAGLLLSYPALRLSGDYFGIATLVFAEMIRLVLLNERWLTKGPMGLPGIPRPVWIGYGLGSLPLFLLYAAAAAALTFALLRAITESPFGRTLRVIREDEYVALALGKNTTAFKRRALIAGSALAGLAGALWAQYITYISPADFTLTETILVLLCVVLGGKGTAWGPVAGAVLVTFFGESVRFVPIPHDLTRLVAPLQGMIYGLLLVLVIMKRPQGLVPEFRRRSRQHA